MMYAWMAQDKRTGRIYASGICSNEDGAKRAADAAARPMTLLNVEVTHLTPPRNYAPVRMEGARGWKRSLNAKGEGAWVERG